MLKRILYIILLLLIAIAVAGLYGILHDQLTYTLSPEYYTKFKFFQFGLIDMGDGADIPNQRLMVAAVGFMATWWMGIFIGIVLTAVGLVHRDTNQMFRITLKAYLLTGIIAFVTGLIGLAYGKLYLSDAGVTWWLPDNLLDRENFIAVGSMHNFSYIGGVIGVVVAAIYSYRKRSKFKN